MRAGHHAYPRATGAWRPALFSTDGAPALSGFDAAIPMPVSRNGLMGREFGSCRPPRRKWNHVLTPSFGILFATRCMTSGLRGRACSEHVTDFLQQLRLCEWFLEKCLV